MTECEEVAAALPIPNRNASLDEVRRAVRDVFDEDESETIIDNVAYALWQRRLEGS